MITYIIQLDDRYWNNLTEWDTFDKATHFFDEMDARRIINKLELPVCGTIRIIKEETTAIFEQCLSDNIFNVIQNYKVSYDTREWNLADMKEKYEDNLEALTSHRNTEFIEKMLVGFPMNTVIIKDNKLPYARNFKTAFDFINDEISLSGNYIPELKGIYYKDLPDYFKDRLLKYNFRIIIIE